MYKSPSTLQSVARSTARAKNSACQSGWLTLLACQPTIPSHLEIWLVTYPNFRKLRWLCSQSHLPRCWHTGSQGGEDLLMLLVDHLHPKRAPLARVQPGQQRNTRVTWLTHPSCQRSDDPSTSYTCRAHHRVWKAPQLCIVNALSRSGEGGSQVGSSRSNTQDPAGLRTAADGFREESCLTYLSWKDRLVMHMA